MLDKLQPEHFSKLLELESEGSKRRDAHRDKVLWASVFVTIFTVVAVFALCWLFLIFNQTDMLKQIITLLIGMVAGGMGGFTVGRTTKNRDEDD